MNLKRLSLCLIIIAVLFSSRSVCQVQVVDSLRGAIALAKDDTNKVRLFISLSLAYKGIDGQKAIEAATSALDLSKKINILKWIALSEHRLGTDYRWKREYENAIIHLREAGRAYRAHGDLIHAAEMLIDVGLCYGALGNIELALDTMAYSATLYSQLLSSSDSVTRYDAKTGIIWSHYFSFATLYQSNELRRALDYLIKLEKAALDFGFDDQLPNTYNSFGATYINLGDLEKAQMYYAKALKIAEETDGWDDQQRLLNNISNIYVRQGDYNKARELLQKAITILLTHLPQRIDYLARLYSSLADVHVKLARYDDALQYYLKALHISDQGGSVYDVARIKSEMANFYYLQKDYAQAIEYLQQAQKLYTQLHNSAGISNVLSELGRIATDRGNIGEAVTYLRQSLEIRRQNGEKFLIAHSMYQIGNVFLKAAEMEAHDSKGINDTIAPVSSPHPDSATAYFTQAEEASRQLSDENTTAICLYGLGRVEELRAHWRRAFSYYDKARHLSDSLGTKRELYKSYAALAAVSAKLGRHDEAYRYHQLYAAIKDTVYDETSLAQTKEMQAKYESEKKDNDIEHLNWQNEISALKVKDQQSALRQARLQTAKNESDIALLNKTKELQRQELLNSQRTVTELDLKAKANAAELELTKKDQLLNEQNLQEQRIWTYGSILFTFLTIVVGVVLLNRLQLRRKLEKSTAILEERKRVAGELHDGLGQYFLVIMNRIKMITRTPLPESVTTDLSEMMTAATLGVEDVRKIAFALSPHHIKQAGLRASVEGMMQRVLNPTGILWTVEMDGAEKVLHDESYIHVYRIIQECINNVMKHANAKHVLVRLNVQGNEATISVTDDGKGFEFKGVSDSGPMSGGYGLRGIFGRAKLLGGLLNVESFIHRGTTVKVTLPVQNTHQRTTS